jgi:hypothetical protein
MGGRLSVFGGPERAVRIRSRWMLAVKIPRMAALSTGGKPVTGTLLRSPLTRNEKLYRMFAAFAGTGSG